MSTEGDVAVDIARATVHPIPIPLVLEGSTVFKSHHFFADRTAGMYHWSAHVSALAPGATPHPPHSHEDEEILMLLSGEVDIVVPEAPAAGGDNRLHLSPGQFAYYPSYFPHTLQTTGPDAANYLMFKWFNPNAAERSDELRFGVFDPWAFTSDEPRGGLASRALFEGSTRYLPRFHCHVSTLASGGGYPPHADPYDVGIVLFEGEVETLGQRVGPHAVIAYPAGAAHGMHNPGKTAARYVVFEFQGTATPYWTHLFHTLLRLPRRALNKAERGLRKAGRMLVAQRPSR